MRVRVLESRVAEKIAAGEVIERPASIVKELVENSLDAGATEISVSLQEGGISLIEVLDNGSGIHPEDLALCIQRHATSKISTFEDLERLSTLGFRGEALPSIAAVAELQIISKVIEQDSAYEWKEGDVQKITFGHFLGSSHGTRVAVRGLFSQIPARLKFLKSPASEVGQIRDSLERLALSRSHVGFSLYSNGKQLLQLRPKSELDRVKEILTDDQDYPILSESFTSENGVTRIYWAQGLSLSHTRKLYQIINQRTVKDRLLQQALLMPFKQSLLPGQFPAVVLFLEEDASKIDFNVHPTKAEVRFMESRRIFQTVESLVTVLIQKNGTPVVVPSSQSHSFQFTSKPSTLFSSPFQASESVSLFQQQELQTESNTLSSKNAHPLSLGRWIGTVFQTYIIYDMGEELALVDQHAADERVRYERLKKKFLNNDRGSHSTQALLIPEAVKLTDESIGMVQARLSWLESVGFEVELFGQDTVLFRGIPAEWGMSGLRHRLKNLMDRLISFEGEWSNSQDALWDEKMFETLASEACHSAVRAGDVLEVVESETLVDQLFECEHPWNCPHGRPTVVRVQKSKLEEWFHRKI